VYASGSRFGASGLWVMDKDGRNKKRLTQEAQAYDTLPAYSPDGRHIVFVSNRAGNFDIWIMDTESAISKQLTVSPDLDTKPAFSPDGHTIVFTSTRSGALQLWIMDSDGSHQKQLTDVGECQDASWGRIKTKVTP
jgi:TolB protein